MSNRATRRSEIARFKREAARGVVSYLVDPDDARLAGEPLLRDALKFWRRNIPTRKPRCFGCKATFSADGVQAAMFLLATPAGAPTSASVSGLCQRCWSQLSDEEVERAAERALRPVMPDGFEP